MWEENQTQYTPSPSPREYAGEELKDQLVKKFSNLNKKWLRKTKRLFNSLLLKKPPNSIEKTKRKIEDKSKCKSLLKKPLNNWGHVKSRLFWLKKR